MEAIVVEPKGPLELKTEVIYSQASCTKYDPKPWFRRPPVVAPNRPGLRSLAYHMDRSRTAKVLFRVAVQCIWRSDFGTRGAQESEQAEDKDVLVRDIEGFASLEVCFGVTWSIQISAGLGWALSSWDRKKLLRWEPGSTGSATRGEAFVLLGIRRSKSN